MLESTITAMLVDALDSFLGSGKTAANVCWDIRAPRTGDGFTDSAHRIAVRNLLGGGDQSAVTRVLDSLVNGVGTSGTLTKTGGGDTAVYAVS